jgi:predicted Zn-dependent peptidase
MKLNITKLDSGLHVITYKMAEVKSVAINLITRVGGRFETEAENGISHFLEHMAFKGTNRRTAKQIAEEFDAIGGQFNAYTSKEHTVYHAKVLSENTETAMDILADIIQDSVFADEDIKKEYDVICQEIAQTIDDPDSLAYEKLYHVAYNNQPFGRSILGTPESISKFGAKDFKKYIAEHYYNDNLFLSLAGDVDHDKIVKMANKLFGHKAGSHKIHLPATYTSGKSIIEKQNLEQSTIVMAYESVGHLPKKEFYHAKMLSLILGGGMSSRLFQRIREQLGLCYSTYSYNGSYSDTGLFCLAAGTTHENLAQVARLLLEEKDKICSDVKEEELARTKAQIKASLVMAEEKSAYKSEEIGKSIAIFGKYEPPEKTLEHINATTVEDIQNIAEKIFSSKMSLSVVTDKKDRLDFLG